MSTHSVPRRASDATFHRPSESRRASYSTTLRRMSQVAEERRVSSPEEHLLSDRKPQTPPGDEQQTAQLAASLLNPSLRQGDVIAPGHIFEMSEFHPRPGRLVERRRDVAVSQADRPIPPRTEDNPYPLPPPLRHK